MQAAAFGFTPDLTILGKAIGGGVPFAALVGKADSFKTIINGTVVHAGTLNANPLCLAASKWCLDEVIARGGYGSPTIFVDKTYMYFGNDQLPLVEFALNRSAA